MALASSQSSDLSDLQPIDLLTDLIAQLEDQPGDTVQVPRTEWVQTLQTLREDIVTLTRKIEESGKQFYGFPEYNPFPALQIDAAGKIQYANKACQLLWKEGEINIGQPVAEPLRAAVQQALRDGISRVIELPLQEYHITFNIVPLPEQDCANLYGSDITLHQKDEDTLRASQEQLKTVLNSITEAYFVLDEEWRIIDYNPTAEREFLKMPKEKLVGKNFWETYPAAVGNEFYQQYHRAFATREPVHFEAISALSLVWYEVHAYPRDGRLEIYLHNINDRKQIEQEREDLLTENQRQKNLLEAVIHQMPAGVIIAEAPSGKLLMSNRRIADILHDHRPMVDTIDTTEGFQGFHPDGQPYLTNDWPLVRSTRSGEVIQGEEIRILRGDGTFGTISVNSAPIYGADEEIIAGVVLFFDITERKQAEQNSDFLANLGEQLLQLEEPDEIKSLATRSLGEYLHLDRCILDEINLDERVILINQDYSRGLPPIVGRFPFSGLHEEMVQRFGRGQIQVVSDTRSDPTTALWFDQGLRAMGILAYIAVPRFKEEGWKATLTAISSQPRQWLTEEINVLRSASDLIWLALEGARVLKNLKDTTRRLDIALKNAPIIVHSLDCDLRYTWVYKPPENFRIEEILGKRYDELVPPEEVAELMELKQSVLECGEGTRKEVRLHLSGEEQIYDVTLEPLRDANGQVIGLTVAGINITSQRQLEAEVRERVAQIEIQRQILRHRELERMEIARDLHDGPLQDMIGLNFAINEITYIDQPEEREAAIHRIQEMLQHQIQDVRTFCYELRPPALTPFGLERAIRSHLDHILKKNNQLKIRQNLMRDGKELPEEIRLALYRVYQESMNNILRHSGATQVWLNFRFDEEKIELEIIDDGKGFNVPFQWVQLAREGHLGVVGMHERVEAVGGSVQIESTPGKGTRVSVTVKR